MKPIVADIFCGVGGISRGFQNAGFEVALGVEKEKHAADIFQRQFPKAKVIVDDIKKITLAEITDTIGKKKIDVLVGGPPCQGFSMAGNRDPSDPRNSLVHEFVRIAKELKPSWILMENVGGLTTAKTKDGKKVIDMIIEEFLPEFNVKPFIVNAADFGVPQKRRRLVLIGNSKGIDFDFTPKRKKWRTVGKLLEDKDKVDKGYFYSEKLIAGFERRERRNKERGFGFRWQFLRNDRPSYTIPARYWKDGANALVKYSKNKIRMLTEKECARIQCLDPRLFNGGSKDYIAIGNAVPPKLVQPFAEKILSYGF
jgi:DNA-cytosine methyltransferase